MTSADLDTLPAMVRCFVGRWSSRLLLTVTAAAFAARLLLGSPTMVDGVVVIVALGLVGPVEWIVHRELFHAPTSSVRRRLGFGRDHAAHHADPQDLDSLFLSVSGAAALAAGVAVFVAAWSAPIGWLADVGLAPMMSGVATALTALCHYEWVHLVAHSRYRPRIRRYRRLARNHRLHHFRDQRQWLGVTTTTGDRLFQTLGPAGAKSTGIREGSGPRSG